MRKRELSNLTDSASKRFNLPKSHILRGKRNFEELFSSSSSFKGKEVILRFAMYPDASRKQLVGFIAPKKIGNAFQRNRTKRLLREAYRLNQHIVTAIPEFEKIGLHYAFIAKRADLTFDSVEHDVVTLLNLLREQILSIKTSS